MVDNEIARIILEQMGGAGTLRCMIGGTPWLLSNGLQVNFKGCRMADRVQIILDWTDTYTVTFYKLNRVTMDCPVVQEYQLVYVDQLVNLFEQFTGLTLRL